MLNVLLKLRYQQVFYFSHRFKNEKKKIKYKKKQKQHNQNHNKTFQNLSVNNNKHIAATTPKTDTTIIMFKFLNMNFINDHILDIIYKIQKCYRYYNDLFNSCNSNSSKRRRIRTEIKTRIRKCGNCFENKTCHCANKFNSGHFNLSYYLRHVSIYSQKNFNHIHFIIVTLLLAFTTTANSIETQEKNQRNLTSLRSLAVIPLMSSNSTDPSFNISSFYIQNALCHDRASKTFSFRQTNCSSLRYYTHHLHHLRTRKLLKVKKRRKINNYKLSKSNRKKMLNIKKHHHHRIYNSTDSNIFNVNTNLKSNSTKDVQNINVFIKQNNKNDYNYSKNINTYDTHPVNMHTNEDVTNANKTIELADDAVKVTKLNYTVDLLPPVTTTDATSHKPTIMEKIFQVESVHHRQHFYPDQQIDHYKLMELVMNGLNLQRAPDMKTVSNS